MLVLDRILSILIIVGGVVHAVGSIRIYTDDPVTLVWALCGSLFIFLFGVISLLRASRPGDKALAWICLVTGLAWIAAALCFGFAAGRPANPHVILVVAITIGMCLFSARTLMMAKR